MTPSPLLREKELLLLRSLSISGGLTVFKLGVFYLTNSIAILASTVDSIMDFMVSLANFILVKSSSKPADHNHPYGHEKIESLAGMAQSLIIGAAALGIAGLAVRRFLDPQPIRQPDLGFAITLVGLAVSLWHAKNLRYSMLNTQSQVMATEYLHYASDALVYLGVMVSFVLCKFTGQVFWDSLISILIAIYLLRTVAEIFRETLVELLDMQLPEPLLREIDEVIRTFDPRIANYHDLRTRKVGPTKFIEFHVNLQGVETFQDAHKLTVGLMEAFQKKYPGAVVTVHADPA